MLRQAGIAGFGCRWGPSVVAVLVMAVAVAGCRGPTAVPVVAPDRIRHTPLAGTEKTTASPTIGPSPTPRPAPTRVVPPPEPLVTDPNFGVGLFADQVGPVRLMAVAPGGEIFATVPARNRIIVLPDDDRDGVADQVLTYAEGGELNYPHGIAFRLGWLYIANTDGVIRFPYRAGDRRARAEPEHVVPLPGGPRHRTRTIVFGPDRRMYVSVGSSCNVCLEQDPRRAAVLRFDVDGGGAAIFARGLRNAVGLAFNPVTGRLWATENGRDGMGDDRPPDELNVLIPGGHYGWPYCYGNQEYDPELGGDREFCGSTIPPAVLIPAHSAPLGMAFYTGHQFPESYQGDLFIAYHGSWERTIPTGYSVVRIEFEKGQPASEPLAFVHGWLRPDTRRWGRPVDVVVAPDGALLVSDDAGQRIYRVFYAAPRAKRAPLR